MTTNIGTTERFVRGFIAISILIWGIMNANIIADSIAGILLFTALSGWCPLYTIFGINTFCNIKKN